MNRLVCAWAVALPIAIAGALACADEIAFEDDFATSEKMDAVENVTRMRLCPPAPLEPFARVDKSDCGLFPTIEKLANGELLAAWHEPRHSVDKENGRDMAAWSTDGGKTWSDAVTAIDVPNVDDRDPIIYQAPDGRVWLGAAGGRLVYSDDNGRTWSAPIKAGGYPVGVLSNGDFLWTCGGGYPEGHPLRKRRNAYARGVRVLKGLKDGQPVWEKKKILCELGDGDEWFLTEGKKPGRMVAMLRQQETGDYYCMSVSDDYGQTFKPYYQSPVWHSACQSRPLLMTMDDGTVVLTYGERTNTRVMAIASFDDGETWQVFRKLVICDSRGLMSGDHSYPDACQIGPHELMAIWYARTGVYVNPVDTRFFKDAYQGVRLADTGLPLDERTIAYWGFNEKDGIIAHEPARYNYGKIAWAKRVPGRLGRAIRFDGDKDYVQVADCDTLRVPRWFTLSAWIRTEAPSRAQTILDKGDPYYLGIEDGKLTFRLVDVAFQSKATIPAKEWTHVTAVVWVANHYTYVSFYVNGVFDSKHKIPGATSYALAVRRSDRRVDGGPLYQEYYPPLGQRRVALMIGFPQAPDKGGPFFGEIDEVMIHAEPLSDKEIKRVCDTRYQFSGKVTSRPIERPEGASWGAFIAQTDTPRQTRIVFSILDENGETLKKGVRPGDDLSAIDARVIRLAADLRTRVPLRTPTLGKWAVTVEKKRGQATF